MTFIEPSKPLSMGKLVRIKSKFQSILIKATRIFINLGEKSWKGSALGTILTVSFLTAFYGSIIKTAYSPLVDILIVFSALVLAIFGIGFILKILFGIFRKFNPYFVAAIGSSFIVGSFLPGRYFIFSLLLVELVCGGIVAIAFSQGIKRISSIFLVLFVFVANLLVSAFLYFDGFNQTVEVNDNYWKQKQSIAKLEDPSKIGKFKVKTLFYGSGTDKNRPEYGKNIALKTVAVDATVFFDQAKGFYNKLRQMYWGFNSKNYPINAQVWYPNGEGSFPLVIIVHGNHIMTTNSEAGYEYLGTLLASRGFIVASVDENFLNASWYNDYNQKEVFARAWLLLKHLENWKTWNQTKGNPFYQKVDMDNIALIGHSRGGAAVAVASVINKLNKYHIDARQEFNFHFSIKGIVQIAPNDTYNPQTEVQLKPENIDYLVLHGGFDQDLTRFLGNRVFNRIQFTDGKPHFKSALYIYRANHGQFNTEWGRKDLIVPLSWLSNLKPIMKANEQRKIAEIYISAFLETTLHGKTEYLTIFKDYRNANSILPKEYYINQFEGSNNKYIADYQEDLDVNTTSLIGCSIETKHLKKWNENALTLRDDWNSSQQNCGVYLAWDNKAIHEKGTAEYSILINDSARNTIISSLTQNLIFSICRIKDEVEKVDFTVELVTKSTIVKKSFSDFITLPPSLKTELSKWNFLYKPGNGKKVEHILQYVEMPFSEFSKADKKFKPSELSEIHFVFDKVNSGEIFLDKIGVN